MKIESEKLEVLVEKIDSREFLSKRVKDAKGLINYVTISKFNFQNPKEVISEKCSAVMVSTLCGKFN